MSTDTWAQPIWQDGEGILHSDLTAASKINLARVTDQMLQRLVGTIAADTDPEIGWEVGGAGGTDDWANQNVIYTMSGADCVVLASPDHPTDHVYISPGTMFQFVNGLDGAESGFIPYQVLAGDGDYAIAANASGNPRIDIIQVKLAWADSATVSRDFKDAVTGALSTQSMSVTRGVTATISVKQGTPGATPSYPAPDAGYAILGAVYVANGFAAGGFGADALGFGASVGILRQCSVPLGIEAITVTPEAFDYSAATNWIHNTHGEAEASGGAGTSLRVWCPRAGQTKRIVGVQVTAAWVTSGTTKLETMRWSAIGHYASSGVEYDVSGTLVVTGGATQSKFAHLGKIADASNKSNPSAANGPVGDPLWAAGGCSGPAIQTVSNTNKFSKALLNIDGGSGTVIAEVTWYLAGK